MNAANHHLWIYLHDINTMTIHKHSYLARKCSKCITISLCKHSHLQYSTTPSKNSLNITFCPWKFPQRFLELGLLTCLKSSYMTFTIHSGESKNSATPHCAKLCAMAQKILHVKMFSNKSELTIFKYCHKYEVNTLNCYGYYQIQSFGLHKHQQMLENTSTL